MAGKKIAIGVDFGATKIMAAALDKKLNILSRVKIRTKAERGPKDTAERMASLAREAATSAGFDLDDIGYVGVGAPGPLNPEEGVILSAPNLGWEKVPLKKMLEADLKVPVVVDNDVNMGTYGEYVAGAAKGKMLVVGIFPGSGIGGGIIIDGKVIHGASGAAGEVGHIIVDPGGALCGCGRRGCVETVASRIAIARDIIAAGIRGQSPYVMEHFGTNMQKLKSSSIAEAIAAGDKVVEQIVRYAARMVGLAASDICNTLSPDCVVLGGGLVEAMPDLFLKEVYKGIQDFTMPAISPYVEVAVAQLGDDAVAVGAAENARIFLKEE